jgi:hypothetical protein
MYLTDGLTNNLDQQFCQVNTLSWSAQGINSAHDALQLQWSTLLVSDSVELLIGATKWELG